MSDCRIRLELCQVTTAQNPYFLHILIMPTTHAGLPGRIPSRGNPRNSLQAWALEWCGRRRQGGTVAPGVLSGTSEFPRRSSATW